MTITVTSEYLYLGAVLILMLIQVLQWFIMSKIKREVSDLWTQISIIAVSSSQMLEKLEKKVDAKEDRKI